MFPADSCSMEQLELKPLFHKRINKNNPDININLLSYQYFEGVDLFAIEGVSHSTVLTLMRSGAWNQ